MQSRQKPKKAHLFRTDQHKRTSPRTVEYDPRDDRAPVREIWKVGPSEPEQTDGQ